MSHSMRVEKPSVRRRIRTTAGTHPNSGFCDLADRFRAQVEWVRTSAIIPYTKNPRRHSTRQLKVLADGISRFGFLVPMIVDETGTLISGHGRVEAAKLVGLDQVPVIRVDHLTPEEVRAFRIADNRISDLSEWDDALLLPELRELSDLPELIELSGFSSGEIDVMLDGAEDKIEPDDIPVPVESHAISRLGDLWQLGHHRLLCASACEHRSYERLLGGEKARTCFVDPPYNVKIDGHVSGLGRVRHREFVQAAGEMTEAQFSAFLTSFIECLAPAMVDGGLAYMCMDWRHIDVLLAAAKARNFKLINMCVWDKGTGGMGSFYRSQHEFVPVFRVGETQHQNLIELGRHGRYRTNVWSYRGLNTFGRNRASQLALHPTVKPIALVADAIRDSTKRGELVIDPFVGSGTTLIAAQRTGRRAACIDLDPLYVDVTIRRWQTKTSERAVHVDSRLTFEELVEQRIGRSANDE